MTNYYIPIIYILPLISVDGEASPRLFIAPEKKSRKNHLLFFIRYFMRTLLSNLQQNWMNLILGVWVNYFISLHYEMFIIDNVAIN